MPRVVITAEVEDGASWPDKVRRQSEVFKTYGIIGEIELGYTDDNVVALSYLVDDVEALRVAMESEATAKAMAEDGVKRETAQILVLDQTWTL